MGLITTAEQLAEAIVTDPERVAACLGRINRFGGQVPNCTVLRHSLEVYYRIDADPEASNGARLWALLHDCHEILTGDVVRPYVNARLRMDQQAIDAVIVRRHREWVKMGLERPRWRDFLQEVERQLGRPVTEQAMRAHCLNTLRCMPREIFRYVGF